LTYNKWRNCACLLFITAWASVGLAQDCFLTLSGTVFDEETKKPLSFANVIFPQNYAGDDSDVNGRFEVLNLCPGIHRAEISHVGYESRELVFDIQENPDVEIFLRISSELLDMASIEAEDGRDKNSPKVDAATIEENADQNLSQLAAKMPGVSLVSTGGKVSKPMIQGMFGNRVTLVNNGVTHKGQQWGADHSPALDPLSADRIEVLTGVSVVEYMGNSIGGVVKLSARSIREERGRHGSAQYFYESNGKGHGLNFKISNNDSILAWGLSATGKKNGDLSAADYFLKNTGSHEANVSGQLEYALSESWTTELYFSSFNAEYGVLRGSHIGNLTDLESAFDQDIPFYTEDNSSYFIDAPHQRVSHQMAKVGTRWDASQKLSLELNYAIQFDQRKEFDVRRGGRTETPALSLEQTTHFVEGKVNVPLESGWEINSGIQYNQINNVNIPETGILPLIPNYLTQEYGAFVRMSQEFGSTSIEIGGRVDMGERKVAAISFSVPREVVFYSNDLFDFNTAAELSHDFSESWSVSLMTGFASRVPDVNELYSNGLHQGVSGIEQGDPNMEREVSHRNGLSLRGGLGSKISIDANAFFQNFSNYILLVPQDEVRLTIRGAFPVFRYEQTDAQIWGYDIRLGVHPNEKFDVSFGYSVTQGADVSRDEPLIYMPANRVFAAFDFELPDWKGLSNLDVGLTNSYVFEQQRYEEGQDFIAPPPGYNLLGLSAVAQASLGKVKTNFYFRVDNLLNVSYRDYLNRLRYFADDLGMNATLGVKFTF
jgi:iron complex outermembrane receptor protein